MKNQPNPRPAHPRRHPRKRPGQPRASDPLHAEALRRRLYTDFLALAFYPGMTPRRADTAA